MIFASGETEITLDPFLANISMTFFMALDLNLLDLFKLIKIYYN
jgi:hypothetical protein